MDNNITPHPVTFPDPSNANNKLDNSNINPDTPGVNPDYTGNVKKPRRYSWRGYSKRRKATIAILAVVLIGGVAAWLVLVKHPKHPASSVSKVQTPTTVPSPLTGVLVAPSLAARPVSAIMIENSDAARPQSGLQGAGVVFEAIAEGGVTRFMALYQEATPQYIGPVRSLRPYYIDYAAPFQATIAHVGGSPDALTQVTSGSYRNLDQFSNSTYFKRINSRDSPHDVYTSFADLDKFNNTKGYSHSSFSSWPRKAEAKLPTPTAKTVNLNISGPDYYAKYIYDPASNSYARSEGGAPHKNLVSASDTAGVQLSPKAVIAMVVPLSNGALDSSGAYYSNYADTGSGKVYIFQDGGVTQGTWSKSGASAQLSFSDASGNTIKLNRGQAWVTLLSNASQVAYTAN